MPSMLNRRTCLKSCAKTIPLWPDVYARRIMSAMSTMTLGAPVLSKSGSTKPNGAHGSSSRPAVNRIPAGIDLAFRLAKRAYKHHLCDYRRFARACYSVPGPPIQINPVQLMPKRFEGVNACGSGVPNPLFLIGYELQYRALA